MPRHKELASMANTSRETVSRTLGLLIDEGVLAKQEGRLLLLRMEALRAHAGVV